MSNINKKRIGLSNIKHYIYKKNIAIMVILCLIILSWIGSLDKYSDKYIKNAIVEAGSAYAIARGINAGVSMLQSTTVSIKMIAGTSISIGEILDPLNDLIERFSGVMTVVLSSLILQKILLIVASHTSFVILLTFLGILSIFIIWKGAAKHFSLILKLFILLVVVRFSLGIVVSLNSVVDNMFLSTQIEKQSSNLNNFKTSIDNIQHKNVLTKKELSEIQSRIQDDILRMNDLKNNQLPDLKKKLNSINKKLIEAHSKLATIKGTLNWTERLNPFNDNSNINHIKKIISNFEDEKDVVETQITEKEKCLQKLIGSIKLKKEQLTGDSNEGFVTKIKTIMQNLKHNLSYSSIKAKVTVFANNIFNLLVLFILKAILIPLTFFYFFIGLAKKAWIINWEHIV